MLQGYYFITLLYFSCSGLVFSYQNRAFTKNSRILTQCTATSTELATPGIEDIPKNLPSVKGIDYVPLATMLAIGDFKGADQFTRDNLIKLAGPDAVKRGFVYWTDVQDIPSEDLATMEKLWLKFSGGNFGYSIQRRIWDVERQDFDNFIRRVGWTKIDNGVERKLKWFPPNEFIYEVEKAPKGHLPLTSALRGTQLLHKLMEHPVWTMYDWKNYESL